MPRCSRRVVTQPERFIGLEEIPVDPETDPCNYNDAVQDKDATLWQRAMKTQMESMLSKSSLASYGSTSWGKTHRL